MVFALPEAGGVWGGFIRTGSDSRFTLRDQSQGSCSAIVGRLTSKAPGGDPLLSGLNFWTGRMALLLLLFCSFGDVQTREEDQHDAA